MTEGGPAGRKFKKVSGCGDDALPEQCTDSETSPEASRRIAEEAAANAGWLDLSKLNLRRLPPEIGEAHEVVAPLLAEQRAPPRCRRKSSDLRL